MKLAEATFLAEALDGWNDWHVVSVDLYGEFVTNDEGYKVKLAKGHMHAQIETPDIEDGRAKLESVEAGETYPNMRPWFYGFLDAFNSQRIRVFLFPPGSPKQRFIDDGEGIQLQVIGYEQNAIGGVDIGVEPPGEGDKE